MDPRRNVFSRTQADNQGIVRQEFADADGRIRVAAGTLPGGKVGVAILDEQQNPVTEFSR